MTTENQDSKSVVVSVSKERFFLDRDRDCNWYLVPVSCRAEWEAWLNRVDLRLRGKPQGVRLIQTSYMSVTFTDPIEIT